MYTLQIQNDRGEIYVLTDHLDEFIVTEITGLDPPRNNINISTSGTLDGGKFNSSHLECRNIVITVVLSGNIEAQRQKLYRIFPLKSAVKVFFREKYRNLMTEGYIEQISVPQFVKLEVAQISIICPSPLWEAIDKIQAEISCSLAGLEFPLDIPPEGIVISERYPYPINIINNPGDTTVGFTAEIRVAEAVADITVESVQSQTPEAIMQKRVLIPLSTSEYNPQTQYLDILVNDVLKTKDTDYTTAFVTYPNSSRDLWVDFSGSILREDDIVTVQVYVWATVPDYKTFDETKDTVLMPDESTKAYFTPPDWYDPNDQTIVSKMYNQYGTEITNYCTLLLEEIEGITKLVCTAGVGSDASKIQLVITKPDGSHQEKNVVLTKSETVSKPHEVFFDISMYEGTSYDAIRYYMGEEKLINTVLELVAITGGEAESLYCLRIGKPMTDRITVNFYSKEGTDISDYTDEQIDAGMKLVDNLMLKNMTTGDEMKFTGEKFKPGDVIGISTVSGDIRVYCVDSDWMEQGQNLMYALDGNSSFPKLRPGENRIVITSDTNQDLLSGYLEAKKLYGGV